MNSSGNSSSRGSSLHPQHQNSHQFHHQGNYHHHHHVQFRNHHDQGQDHLLASSRPDSTSTSGQQHAGQQLRKWVPPSALRRDDTRQHQHQRPNASASSNLQQNRSNHVVVNNVNAHNNVVNSTSAVTSSTSATTSLQPRSNHQSVNQNEYALAVHEDAIFRRVRCC